MFIYSYAHIDRPFAEVNAAVLRAIPRLSAWAGDAYRGGERLTATIGGTAVRIAKSIEMTIDPPRIAAMETWIPIRWEATGPAAFFPRMEADIVVAAVGHEQTQIALRGSYTVPLRVVGRALDRTLLHRVAEASVKEFVDRIATSISTTDASGPEVVTR